MNCKVIIRVDGNSEIGLGHFVRCIALAHMLKHEFDILFVSKDIPDKIKFDLESNNFKVKIIIQENNFLELLEHQDIVVVDGYQFGANYQKKIKTCGCKLVCIDDLHDKKYYADLIINHVPGVNAIDYNAQTYTQFALGPNYALLRPSFLRNTKDERKNETIETIFICFGGSDPKNLTLKTLKIVQDYLQFKKIIVVIGTAYSQSNILLDFAKNKSKILIYKAIDEKQMYALMKEADMAIVPASGILYEVLSLKIPVITGTYSNNQSVFIREFTKFQHVINAKRFAKIHLKESLHTLLNNKIICKSVVDGNSGTRILKSIKDLNEEIYIITGANSGLGKALVENLLEIGKATVISFSRTITKEQQKQKLTNNFIFIKQDFSKRIQKKTITKLFEFVMHKKKIIFINNASTIDPICKVSELTDIDVERALKVNVFSPIILIKHFLEKFPEKEIDFINITSGAAHKSIANWSIYSSSKAFIHRFFDVLKEEYKDNLRFRFLSIDPGIIDTKMQEKIRSSDFPIKKNFTTAKRKNLLLSPHEASNRILNFINSQ